MDPIQSDPTELVLSLTLEMVLLLTGEDYLVVKKPEERTTNRSLQLVEGSCGGLPDGDMPSPQRGMHEPRNKQKILELTNRIIELLTGEAPIRCQDVAVFFSSEEREYVEEHKELYKDVMTKNHQLLISPGLPKGTTTEYPAVWIKEEHYGENVTNPDIYLPTEQNRFTNLDEEVVSCEGGNLIKTTQPYPFTHIKEEPVSCNIGTLTHLYPPAGIHTPQYSYTYIKEESRSHDGTNLKGHKNTPLDEPQAYLPTHIKDEPVLQDGESLIDPNVHIDQCSSGGNKEAVPCSGGNLLSNAHHSSPRAKERPKHRTSPELHSRANDGLKIQYSCSECKKCFLAVAELLSHQGIHIAERLLQSGPHVFTTTVVHAAQVPPVKHKLLACSKCERTFYTKSSLAGHMKTHWGEINHLKNETFKCEQCGKCFSTRSLLHMHSRLHCGDRPYACRTCGERFMRTSDLGRHQRKHQ